MLYQACTIKFEGPKACTPSITESARRQRTASSLKGVSQAQRMFAVCCSTSRLGTWYAQLADFSAAAGSRTLGYMEDLQEASVKVLISMELQCGAEAAEHKRGKSLPVFQNGCRETVWYIDAAADQLLISQE